MKKRIKSFITVAALFLAAGVFTTAGLVALADNQPSAGMESPLAERVLVGEEVSIPNYYVQSGDKLVKAVANIVTPSGAVYAGSKFTATEGGRYIVEYTLNGKVVHTEDCLSVIGSADLIKTNALASVDGLVNYKYNPDDAYKGVAVNVSSGASVTFDREIDMTSLTKDDVLFEGTIEPLEQGEADFMQMVLTFTDVENDSLYFRITATDGHADGGSPKHVIYLNGAANGQTAGGMNYEGEVPRWQQKDIYGTSTPSSFRAVTYNGYSLHSIKLFYDAKENAIYTHTYENQVIMVVDFDDPVVFGGNVWSGFESGKAKLSVSFIDTKEAGGRVIFNEIGGLRLDQNEIVDMVAPDIKVDLDGESKAPNALLGTNYRVFPCSAYDFFDLNVQIKTTVSYENIFTGEKSDVAVQDGKFVTDKLGMYTIRYEATDYTGNTSVEEYSFECIANAEEIVFSNMPENFSAPAFTTIKVPATNSIRAFGGNGTLKITMQAFDCDGIEIAVEKNVFIPEKLGEYKVVYTATDYYGVSKTAELKINVTENNDTVFMNELVLPDMLIVGFKYTIPEVKALTCYNGEVINCNMVYIVNGVTLDETRTFVADNASTQADIVCKAMIENFTCGEIRKTSLVIDGDHGRNQAAYFYDKSNLIQVTQTQETIDLTTAKDSSVAFVNKLKGSAFSLGVNYLANECKFGSFNVTLSDAVNSNVNVTLKFIINGDEVKVITPYGAEVVFPSADGYFELNFDGNSGIVNDANGLPVTVVDLDDKGNTFVGFANGLYASMAFSDVAATSKVSLSLLNNQPLGLRGETDEETKDLKGPEIETLGELSLKAKLGDALIIYAAQASDVLSQVTSTTVRVVSPSGKDIVAERNANENLSIPTTETGTYKVYYFAYDSEGNRTRIGKNIRVLDSIAPTLEVSFSDVTKKVGETIKLPTVKLSDDSGSVNYDIFLSLPNSEMRLLYHFEDGDVTSYLDKENNVYPNSFKVSDTEFKLEQKGKYVLTVMAYDAQYNLTMKSFTITVR